MGKRKDRILAAMSNAGRRVKLDLSAEPSGDLGGSTVHDEVGKDTELKERAGLPNSPSSSGGFCQFSSKGLLCRVDMSAQHYLVELWNFMCKAYYVVCTKNLFSECRMAVVLGTFISDQVGPVTVIF